MTDVVTHGAMQHAMAFANELAKAELLPKPYQRKPAMILMAMEISKDLGCSVVAVINGTYEIGGRLSFYTDFMLAQARRSGVIKSVSYESTGEGQKLVVTARAVLAHGEVVECSIGMAEAAAEGWTRNSKYRSMPEQMLRKRAIKRLISNYCPEVLLGAADDEETIESNVPNGISALTERLMPAQPRVVEPEAVTEAVTEAVPVPVPTRSLATEKRIEEIKASVPEATAVVITGECAPFDFDQKEHRALVTDAFNALEIDGRTRNLHRAKLEAYLRSLGEGLRADAPSVLEAVTAYFDALAPKGAQA